jgi:predicted O-linked N-acetylglucosamine transferase (SPINDLY family)
MALVFPQPTRPAHGHRAEQRALRHWQTGVAQAGRARWPAAAAEFVQANALHGDAAYALAAAHALIKAGRLAEAVDAADAARRGDPQLLIGYTLQAQALLGLGRAAEALACLQGKPPALVPDHPFLAMQADALKRLERYAEAVPVYLQALALKIDDPYLHYHLGNSFRMLGLKAEAAECLRTALALGIGSSELALRGQLAFLEREACRWPEAAAEMAALRERVLALPPGSDAETCPFTHAVVSSDPLEQRRAAEAYARHKAHEVRPLPPVAARDHGGRLRIGYLSSDFHSHATSQLLVQVLEAHDRGRFEVFVLSAGPDDGSALRRRVQSAAEHFVELRGRDAQHIAERVRELRIDLLVDLKGATYDNLLAVFAARPAPLQASWLGYPGTTGAPTIDYLIGDPVVTPLGHAAHFSEAIAQLPGCYQPNDAKRARPAPSVRADWGLPEDGLLLCAFHQSYKISEEVFDTWCALLHARPDAKLWLLRWNTNVEQALRDAAVQRGIAPERLLFAPLLPLEQHLSRLAHADLYLDAWPCNAHTTAGEALWVGVPVVTLQGPTFAQRVAASLLHAVRLEELVAADRDAYVAAVLALAADAPRRAALRAHLRAQREASALFDGVGFARELEALYRRMWARAVAGHPPAPLAAELAAAADGGAATDAGAIADSAAVALATGGIGACCAGGPAEADRATGSAGAAVQAGSAAPAGALSSAASSRAACGPNP